MSKIITDRKTKRPYVRFRKKKIYLDTLMTNLNKKRKKEGKKEVMKITSRNVKAMITELLYPVLKKDKKPKKIKLKKKDDVLKFSKFRRPRKRGIKLGVSKMKSVIEKIDDIQKKATNIILNEMITDVGDKDFEIIETYTDVIDIYDMNYLKLSKRDRLEYLLNNADPTVIKKYNDYINNKGKNVLSNLLSAEELTKIKTKIPNTPSKEEKFAGKVLNKLIDFLKNIVDHPTHDIALEDINYWNTKLSSDAKKAIAFSNIPSRKTLLREITEDIERYIDSLDEIEPEEQKERRDEEQDEDIEELEEEVKEIKEEQKEQEEDLEKLNEEIEKILFDEEEQKASGVLQRVIDFTRQIFKGRDQLAYSSQKKLDKWKDHEIKEVFITRAPIQSGITKLANLLTDGEFEKDMIKHGHDDLFHLALNIILDNDVCLTVQKNDTLYIDRGCNYNKGVEDLQVKKVNVKGKITFGDAYEKMTKGYSSPEELYGYDSRDNNCQRFVDTYLSKNSDVFDYTSDDKNFVVQDIKGLLDEYSGLQKVSRVLTDLGNRLSLFLTGGMKDEEDIQIKYPGRKMKGGLLDQDNQQLSTSNIEEIMKRYKGFIGVYPQDLLYQAVAEIDGNGKNGIIMNLDNSGEPGSHWVAIFAEPRSVEYYDSFGKPPSSETMRQLKRIGKKMNGEIPKLKINKVVNQDSNSVSCGYISSMFLMDRFRGKGFKKATGYSIKKREDQSEDMYEKFKYMIN